MVATCIPLCLSSHANNCFVFLSSIPPYPSLYYHMSQVSVNYPGNPSSDEHTYQPYMEDQ